MSIGLTAFLLLSVFVTSLLSGVLGMAGGMILMGALAFAFTVPQAMILHAVAQFFANASRAFIHRAHIHWPSARWYLLGLAGGFIIFCFLSFVPNKITLFTILGAIPFLPLFFPPHIRFDFTRPVQAAACGLVVTCLQLTAGVAGPILDVFFQKVPLSRHQNVATKAFTQSVSHAGKFLYFGVLVQTQADASVWLDWWIYPMLVPVAILGSHTAKYFLDRISDKHFYRTTQIILWMIGAIYLAKAAALVFHA